MYPEDMVEVLQMEHRRGIDRVNRTWWMFEGTPLSSSRRTKKR